MQLFKGPMTHADLGKVGPVDLSILTSYNPDRQLSKPGHALCEVQCTFSVHPIWTIIRDGFYQEIIL